MNSRSESIEEFQKQANAVVTHVRILQEEAKNLDDHKILEYLDFFKMINKSISEKTQSLYDS